MRTLTLSLVLVILLSSLPTAATAQRRGAAPQPAAAKHEFGVDLGLAYADVDGLDSGLRFGTPLDVRVGFVPRGKLMFEGRANIQFDSGTYGESFYALGLGANVLYPLGRNTHRRGTFLTGGVALLAADDGVDSGTGFSFNGAIGTRSSTGSNSGVRLEGGIRFDTEIGDVVPSTLWIGGRVGLSFWR